jgi:hypothetical protein
MGARSWAGQGPRLHTRWRWIRQTRARLHDPIRSRIPLQKDGSICLAARAWAVRAMVVDGNASKIRKSTVEVVFELSGSHPRTFLPLIAHDRSRRP